MMNDNPVENRQRLQGLELLELLERKRREGKERILEHLDRRKWRERLEREEGERGWREWRERLEVLKRIQKRRQRLQREWVDREAENPKGGGSKGNDNGGNGHNNDNDDKNGGGGGGGKNNKKGNGNGNGDGGDKPEAGSGSRKIMGMLDFKGKPGFGYDYTYHTGFEHWYPVGQLQANNIFCRKNSMEELQVWQLLDLLPQDENSKGRNGDGFNIAGNGDNNGGNGGDGDNGDNNSSGCGGKNINKKGSSGGGGKNINKKGYSGGGGKNNKKGSNSDVISNDIRGDKPESGSGSRKMKDMLDFIYSYSTGFDNGYRIGKLQVHQIFSSICPWTIRKRNLRGQGMHTTKSLMNPMAMMVIVNPMVTGGKRNTTK